VFRKLRKLFKKKSPPRLLCKHCGYAIEQVDWIKWGWHHIEPLGYGMDTCWFGKASTGPMAEPLPVGCLYICEETPS